MRHVKNIISLSGGKDSTALLLLSIERNAENASYVFADTGNENQITYDYVDYLSSTLGIEITRVKACFADRIAKQRAYVDVTWRKKGVEERIIERALKVLHPTGNPFFDLCLLRGRFPSSQARFCTSELKINPMEEQIINPMIGIYDAIITWTGERHDESLARSKLEEKSVVFGAWHPEPNGVLIYRPMLGFTAQDAFAMHDKHNIKPNPLYTLGMSRVGCMPCVNARKDDIREISKRFPSEIDRIREWESIISMASKRCSSTFFYALLDPTASENDDITPETHGIDRVVEWSKTARGGRQYDLLATDAPTQCSSSYGLCES